MENELKIILQLESIEFYQDRGGHHWAKVTFRISQPDGVYRDLVEVVSVSPLDQGVDQIVNNAYESIHGRLLAFAALAKKGWRGQADS